MNETQTATPAELAKRFPLYSLVWVSHTDAPVEGGRYSDVGQVLSLPIPDASPDSEGGKMRDETKLMIRRVPGHPGTLEEIAINRLNPHHNDPKFLRRWKFVHYARVRGVGSFPTDMLRYDRCTPVNFALAEKRPGDSSWGYSAVIKPDFLRMAGHPVQGQTDLIVAQVGNSASTYTPARWSSFLWSLKVIHSERIHDLPE